jgi:hypothetical protein
MTGMLIVVNTSRLKLEAHMCLTSGKEHVFYWLSM